MAVYSLSEPISCIHINTNTLRHIYTHMQKRTQTKIHHTPTHAQTCMHIWTHTVWNWECNGCPGLEWPWGLRLISKHIADRETSGGGDEVIQARRHTHTYTHTHTHTHTHDCLIVANALACSCMDSLKLGSLCVLQDSLYAYSGEFVFVVFCTTSSNNALNAHILCYVLLNGTACPGTGPYLIQMAMPIAASPSLSDRISRQPNAFQMPFHYFNHTSSRNIRSFEWIKWQYINWEHYLPH